MRFCLTLLLVTAVATAATRVSAVPSASATIVQLRQSCFVELAGPEIELSDCVTTMSQVIDWMTGTWDRQQPVLIEIGPGTYGPFTCNALDHFTRRGSGQENTVIDGGTGTAIAITNCSDASFEDLTVKSKSTGVHWSEDGNFQMDRRHRASQEDFSQDLLDGFCMDGFLFHGERAVGALLVWFEAAGERGVLHHRRQQYMREELVLRDRGGE